MTQVAAQKSPLQPLDVLSLKWVLDPALASDGQCAYYILKDVDPAGPREGYRYRLVRLDLSPAAQAVNRAAQGDVIGRIVLPGLDATVRHPRVAPDDRRIAFLASQTGRMQVWVLDLESGALAQLTNHPLGVSELAWSPDGRWIAHVADVRDATGAYGEEEPGLYRVIRRVGYKDDGIGYWGGAWSHVFVVSSDVAEAGSPPMRISTGKFDHAGVAWSADGRRLAFVSSGEDDPDLSPWRHLFVVDLEFGASAPRVLETRQVTHGLAAGPPTWSPDGRFLACLAHDNGHDRVTTRGVWVIDTRAERSVNLTADIDRPAGDYVADDMNAEATTPPPAWRADASGLLALMSNRGRSFVVQIDFPGEAAFDAGHAVSDLDRPATEDPWHHTQFNARPVAAADQRVFAFHFDGQHRVVTAQSEPDSPGDVYLLDIRGAATHSTRLTRVNGALLSARRLSTPEPVAFEGSLGRRIEGWLLPPTNGAQAPYPLVLHVHGGPHSAYSPAFNFELQQLAADGYAVLYLNPHGSQTYGLEIARGTQLDWGGKDFDDLMLGVDHALQRPDVDRERLGVAGGSYGGWMTNYVVTHTTRFKGAVAQRSSSNRISTMLSSAEGYRHARWEAPGYPWDHLDYFVRISPVFRAAHVETPLLLLHEEEDHLCPLMQAEEMFTALKCLGRTVELVVFLGESHYMLRTGKPANRVERLLRTTDWFRRYV